MKINLHGTESLENVKTAFACESQARNRYTYFAMQARLEGDIKTAELFEEMANNEKEHAKVWYKVLNSGLSSTLQNLEDSSNRESEEWESMYPAFAQTAREEGLELLAIMFDNIAAIEKNHEMLFKERLGEVKTNSSSDHDSTKAKSVYVCQNCGFVSDELLPLCTVCEEENTFKER